MCYIYPMEAAYLSWPPSTAPEAFRGVFSTPTSRRFTMLRLNASFQKKVPADQEYSSQSYLASVELELPAGLTESELKEKIAHTFRLVRDSVEAELAKASAPAAMPEPRHLPNPAEGRASNKQIAYLLDLSKARNMTLMQLNADIQARFGVDTVYDLDRKTCSRLIDEHQRAA
jgi:hypothetical protein